MLPPSWSLLSAAVLATGALGQTAQWSIERRDGVNARARRATSQAVDSPIQNEVQIGGYFLNVTVGTPGQQLVLQLDTGSSDFWVPTSNAAACRQRLQGGCTLGTFNPDTSSTFDNVTDGSFTITYQDDSYSNGNYFRDEFRFGSASVSNFTMGLGDNTTIPYGLAGVGYAADEASLETSSSAPYQNLPLALTDADLISTPAYSLWLNDLGARTGQILFGAIDTEKYVGELKKVPVLRNRKVNRYTAFAVSLHSVEATSPSGTDILTSAQLPMPVILDSGTTYNYLPQDMASQVWEEVGARYEPSFGLPLLPCSFANHAGRFSFTFGGPDGPRIDVAMDELVVPLQSDVRFPSGPYRGRTACAMGILAQDNPPFLLGDTFLRSAYVVYDLFNNEIGIAPTNFNSSKSNIIAFASKGASIPSATAVANQPVDSSPPKASPFGMNAAKGFQAGGPTTFSSPLSSVRLVTMCAMWTYIITII